MSLASLEREILAEAKTAFNNKKLRLKDLLEWSTAKVKPRNGEAVLKLDDLKVNVRVAKDHDKRAKLKQPMPSKPSAWEARNRGIPTKVKRPPGYDPDEPSHSDHPSGLSGEHDVVLDAIQAECLGGD